MNTYKYMSIHTLIRVIIPKYTYNYMSNYTIKALRVMYNYMSTYTEYTYSYTKRYMSNYTIILII